ncbi:MAG: ABC transporter substrate-binding protein [Acidimicrobiales bacterium]
MGRVVDRRALCLVAVLGVVGLALSSCGTRLPNSAFGTSSGVGASVSAGGPAASGSGGGTGNSGGTNASGLGGSVPGASSSGATPGAASAGGGAGSNGAGGASAGAGGAGGPSGAGSGTSSGASDVGVTASTITIGNVTSVQGALGPDAFGVSLPGLQAWVAATNANGGINGRKIVLDTCDDSENGQQNLTCTNQLVSQDHVFALIGNNSDACASSAHYEYTQGVPDVGFPLCNGYYKYPNMFSIYGTGYPRKGAMPANEENQANIYKWFATTRHVSRGAFFFYIIPISAQQGYAEEAEAKSVGIATTYEGGGSHQGENPADPTFDTDVINMREDKVDSVYDAMDVAGNEKLCAAMDRQGFTVKAKVSTVEVFGQSVGQWSSPCRDSVYSADSSAPYSDTSNPVVAQFRRAMSTYEPTATMHQWALDGYALGILFGDAVSSMGAKVTRAGFMKWLDAWKQPQAGGPGYTFDGLMSPLAWAPMNYNQPSPACDSIAQWNDAAGTFVTVAGINTCYNLGWLPTAFSNDGS